MQLLFTPKVSKCYLPPRPTFIKDETGIGKDHDGKAKVKPCDGNSVDFHLEFVPNYPNIVTALLTEDAFEKYSHVATMGIRFYCHNGFLQDKPLDSNFIENILRFESNYKDEAFREQAQIGLFRAYLQSTLTIHEALKIAKRYGLSNIKWKLIGIMFRYKFITISPKI